MLKSVRPLVFLAAALPLSAPAWSVPITGEVEIRGFIITDSGDLENASSLCAQGRAMGGTGSYAPIEGQSVPVNHRRLTFSLPLSEPVNPLWSFLFQGVNYGFVLDEVGVVEQSANSLMLSGMASCPRPSNTGQDSGDMGGDTGGMSGGGMGGGGY